MESTVELLLAYLRLPLDSLLLPLSLGLTCESSSLELKEVFLLISPYTNLDLFSWVPSNLLILLRYCLLASNCDSIFFLSMVDFLHN